jgi:shikimate dehydrogenase
VTQLPGRLVLLGHPVGHSLSPAFQNAALRRAALPVRYEALDVAPEALDATLAELIAIRAAGNVTIPYKERVAAHCARLTPLAERVGAVNTFWVENAGLVGDNTDVGGFVHALSLTAPNADTAAPVAVLGAGGSAAAVLAGFEQQGFTDIRVHARTTARATALTRRFSMARTVDTVADALLGADLVVHATPVGLDGSSIPFDLALLQQRAVVLDLVFGRDGTALVRAARERGHRAADGLEMLLEQGALAFERWFGVEPDRAAMREAVSR